MLVPVCENSLWGREAGGGTYPVSNDAHLLAQFHFAFPSHCTGIYLRFLAGMCPGCVVLFGRRNAWPNHETFDRPFAFGCRQETMWCIRDRRAHSPDDNATTLCWTKWIWFSHESPLRAASYWITIIDWHTLLSNIKLFRFGSVYPRQFGIRVLAMLRLLPWPLFAMHEGSLELFFIKSCSSAEVCRPSMQMSVESCAVRSFLSPNLHERTGHRIARNHFKLNWTTKCSLWEREKQWLDLRLIYLNRYFFGWEETRECTWHRDKMAISVKAMIPNLSVESMALNGITVYRDSATNGWGIVWWFVLLALCIGSCSCTRGARTRATRFCTFQLWNPKRRHSRQRSLHGSYVTTNNAPRPRLRLKK